MNEPNERTVPNQTSLSFTLTALVHLVSMTQNPPDLALLTSLGREATAVT